MGRLHLCLSLLCAGLALAAASGAPRPDAQRPSRGRALRGLLPLLHKPPLELVKEVQVPVPVPVIPQTTTEYIQVCAAARWRAAPRRAAARLHRAAPRRRLGRGQARRRVPRPALGAGGRPGAPPARAARCRRRPAQSRRAARARARAALARRLSTHPAPPALPARPRPQETRYRDKVVTTQEVVEEPVTRQEKYIVQARGGGAGR
jgi:hypothetical protein